MTAINSDFKSSGLIYAISELNWLPKNSVSTEALVIDYNLLKNPYFSPNYTAQDYLDKLSQQTLSLPISFL